MIKKCLICDKEFDVRPAKVRQGYGKYCSQACYRKSDSYKVPAAWNKGKKASRKAIENQSKAQLKMNEERRKKGISHWNQKNGVRKSNGYIEILSPFHPYKNKSNHVKRSRLIIEAHLKRFLKSCEVVHHINEIKDDDRIENLYLFPTRQDHDRYHATINNPNPKCCRKLSKNKYILKSNLLD